MNILVLGANGQVGTHLSEILPQAHHWTRKDLDLAYHRKVRTTVEALNPDTVINCAAYTQVDNAEFNPREAWEINAHAVATLASCCKSINARLIHLSTDYVFDGRQSSPYKPTDPPRPISVYGKTKLAGELAISAMTADYLVFRVSWIFSNYGNNFVKTMLRLAKDRPALNIVNNEFGRPTYAGDLAKVIAAAARLPPDRLPSGVYHISGGPKTSWFDFARQIFRLARQERLISDAPILTGIPASEYPTIAPRPSNSVLAPSRKLSQLSIHTPNWRAGLQETIQRLKDTV